MQLAFSSASPAWSGCISLKCASLDDSTECLELHLKVVLKGYCGKGVEVDFARFSFLNVKVLEIMEFRVVDNWNNKWRAKQNGQLQVEDRASRRYSI